MVIFRYTLASPMGPWQATSLIRPTDSNWFHIIVNFLGLDGYRPLRVFHDRVQHKNQYTITYSPTRRLYPSDKIVIGKADRPLTFRNVTYGGTYASFDMDEVVFFDHALSSEERRTLRQL